MSDLAAPSVSAPSLQAAPRPRIFRPAGYGDIDLVHARLMEAIATSPHYGQSFKDYETARLTKDHLAGLIDADPHHVLVFLRNETPAGFMVSGPELGTLWLYWSYVFPEHRRSSLGVSGMRAFVEHWDNGRFHKIATYTKTGNEVAEAIMRRFGYEKIAVLEKHIFGEDYILYERPLNKMVPGYDRGVPGGLVNRLKRRIRRLTSR